MEIAVLAIILVVGFSEWREHKLREHMEDIADSLKAQAEVTSMKQKMLEQEYVRLAELVCRVDASQARAEERAKNIESRVLDASIHLATIVQEYEINGIWLGKDRNKRFDVVEG